MNWTRISPIQVNHALKKWDVPAKAKAFTRRNDLPTNRQVYGFFPITDWLSRYNKEWLRPDVIAGLTTAAVVIPKAVAYATIAGLPVQVGLYTAFVSMVIYAVLGTALPLSVSTTTTIAILTASELGEVAPAGDAADLMRTSATLTLLVGAILVLAAVLRLGFVAKFISEPVLVGFKAGIGLVIVMDQVPKILGIHFAKGSFLHNVFAIVKSAPEASLPTLAMGIAMIVVLLGLERFLPRVPAPLVAIALGILGTRLFGLQAHGVEVVGRISQGLPSLAFPDFSLAEQLWPKAPCATSSQCVTHGRGDIASRRAATQVGRDDTGGSHLFHSLQKARRSVDFAEMFEH
jgi:Sulfate permease and related transporters (MFS superfamily)